MPGKLRCRVRIKKGVELLRGKLDDAALELAAAQRANITRRLNRGQGLYRELPPYSAVYATQRSRRGRQTRVRDLQLTGMMLRDIHEVLTARGRASLRFRTSSQKVKAWANQRREPWFGMTEDDVAVLRQLLLRMGARAKR